MPRSRVVSVLDGLEMIGVEAIAAAVDRAHQSMATLEQELNRADAVLGDGDTGGMLARVLAGMSEQDLRAAPDLGVAFGLLARAASANTGSSLGTLLATALMSFAKAHKGRQLVEWPQLGHQLAAARDSMLERGGAALGDKTVLDALDAVARAVAGISEPLEISRAATKAAHEALEIFRQRPCKIGRARIFGEKSVGLDDPGMLAFVKLTDAVINQDAT